MNGFDFVLTSLELMKNEKPIQNILQAIVPSLEITNSIFNKNNAEDEESSHPNLKILVAATMKLQEKLRKGLFSWVFTPEDAKVITEFFECKNIIDNKDEFVVQSYKRAITASEVYEYAWKYRLNMNDSDEGEITSASEFDNLYKILNQILQCIELCLDFPFESKYTIFNLDLDWLLSLIEYWEVIEVSWLNSKLEDTISLFINYMKIPLEEVRIRIIKKMVKFYKLSFIDHKTPTERRNAPTWWRKG